MDLNDAKTLALDLMDLHRVHLEGWDFRWSTAKQIYGYTDYRNKTLSFSRPITLLNDEHEFEQMVLHEIAHVIAGPRAAAHGAEWKRIVRRIGGTDRRCHSAETPEPTWVGTCPACGHMVKRFRRGKALACGRCCDSEWQEEFVLTWARNPALDAEKSVG